MNSFWQNKKVLITGHTGFKGAWLSYLLHGWGARVSGISLPPEGKNNLFGILSLADKVTNFFVDIRDYKKLKTIVGAEQPEVVFHLAAQPLVREGYRLPLTTHSTNILGTANVLQSLIGSKTARAAVIITTDKVYENKEWVHPYRENDALGGYDPYSASKAAADIVANSYSQSFFNPRDYGHQHETLVAIARAGNVIGGGDWGKDRLVPDMVRAIFERREPIIIRKPEAVRPWQHVLESLSGYLLLAQKLYIGEKTAVGSWNFGPRDEGFVTVEELLKTGIAILGVGNYQVERDNTAYETTLLKLDISKAQNILGWQPRWNFYQAVEKTFAWYAEYYKSGGGMANFTATQIADYFAGEKYNQSLNF